MRRTSRWVASMSAAVAGGGRLHSSDALGEAVLIDGFDQLPLAARSDGDGFNDGNAERLLERLAD